MSSFLAAQRGALGVPLCGVREVLGIQLEAQAFKVLIFQSEIIYLAHHVSQQGILPSRDNVRAVEEFLIPETYTQVHMFCGLVGHYWRFIKGLKMGPVDLPPKAWEAVNILKRKVQSMPVLVFPDFNKPFCLRQMSLGKDWESSSPRSRVMNATIELPLTTAP